jgi:ribosomal protein L7/L12
MIFLWIVLSIFGVFVLAYIFISALRGSTDRRSEILPASGKATMADVERLVQEGRRIDAIRCYREIHRCGLVEAKEAIDKYPH